MRLLSAVVVLGSVVGCARGIAQTPAPPPSVPALAGRWAGSYGAADQPRGRLSIVLSAEGDSAWSGNALMIPAGGSEPVHGAGPGGPPFTPAGPTPEPLTIRLVPDRRGSVAGVTNAYRLPACSCVAITQLTGSVAGDTLRGDFTTTRADGGPASVGTWELHRDH